MQRGNMTRTPSDILAERRTVVQEQRRERDKTARAILQYQIDEIDRELTRSRAARSNFCPLCGQTPCGHPAGYSCEARP